MTIAAQPNLERRITDAVIVLLSALSGLSGVTIRAADDSDAVASPYIVVQTTSEGEAIYNSGIRAVRVSAILKTTAGEGPKASTDAQLLTYDAAFEQFIFAQSMKDLAAAITAAGEFFRLYNVTNPTSAATTFDESKREIEYAFDAHAVFTES